MRGSNPEQLASHPRLKKVMHNIMDDWNSLHKEQTSEEKKKLTIQRLTLTIAKYIEQPNIYNQLINANIDLNET